MKDGDLPALIQGLRDGGDRREAAIARLIIAGKRAVVRLVAAYQDTTDREVQVAILRVLEATGDDRALAAAETAIAARGDVAVAGIAVLRELMARPETGADVKALDVLLAIARDPSAERRVRAAAVSALDSAPADVRQAIGGLAASDSPLPAAESPDDALWEDALNGQLPDDPARLREAIPVHAPAAPLADLRRLIEALAAREQGIALYDLRETFERAAAPLPSAFLGAVQTIGDDSCLEPLAGAFVRAKDARWEHQIAQAFHEIVKRERITKRHSAFRRALAKAPDLAG